MKENKNKKTNNSFYDSLGKKTQKQEAIIVEEEHIEEKKEEIKDVWTIAFKFKDKTCLTNGKRFIDVDKVYSLPVNSIVDYKEI